MTSLTTLIVVIILMVVPTPNATTLYIKTILIAFCTIFSISQIDWIGFFDYVNNLLKQYHIFLLEKTGNEKTANFIGFLSIFLLMQPIIIGGYFLLRKKHLDLE